MTNCARNQSKTSLDVGSIIEGTFHVSHITEHAVFIVIEYLSKMLQHRYKWLSSGDNPLFMVTLETIILPESIKLSVGLDKKLTGVDGSTESKIRGLTVNFDNR